MQLDMTVSIGSIINMITILGGGLAFLMAIKSNVVALGEVVHGLNARVGDIETDIRKLNEVIIANARVEERLSAMRADLSSFATAQTNSHTEWRQWVRGRFDVVESRMSELERKN